MSRAAEAFSPGDFLAEELEARGWTQVEFAEIIERPTELIGEIVRGKKQITTDTAILIGNTLGTSAELWLNLERQYQLSKAKFQREKIDRQN